MTRAPRPITLACLDMAGTTVSDEGVVEAAFLDALDQSGVPDSDERRKTMLDYVRETMGTSKITVFHALFPGGDDADKANSAFEAAYDRRLGEGAVRPMPGAEETIRRLREEGIKVSLLTGFSAATHDRLVEALGWQEIADLLISPAEAGRGRPYPDMVLCSLLRLGIDDVASVAVVGDTAADIESGLRAGAGMVIGVTSGADPEERLRAAGASDVLANVTALPDLLSR